MGSLCSKSPKEPPTLEKTKSKTSSAPSDPDYQNSIASYLGVAPGIDTKPIQLQLMDLLEEGQIGLRPVNSSRSMLSHVSTVSNGEVKVLRYSSRAEVWWRKKDSDPNSEPPVLGAEVTQYANALIRHGRGLHHSNSGLSSTEDEGSVGKRSREEGSSWMVTDWMKCGKLGEGSYGKVYLYQQTSTGRRFAIKVCKKDRLRKKRFGLRETALDALTRGISIHTRLHHPNIVPLLQVIDDIEVDRLYMVLEFKEKGDLLGDGSLGDLQSATSPPYSFHTLSIARCRKVVKDILQGLVYLKQSGVVHGDIKPDNVLMSADGTVQISDFGVSERFPPSTAMVMQRSPGTPVFFAPECCEGDQYLGPAADMWAVGICTFVWLVGRLPYLPQGGQLYDKLLEQINTQPLPVPVDLQGSQAEDFLKRVLCIDPDQRIAAEDALKHPWILEE